MAVIANPTWGLIWLHFRKVSTNQIAKLLVIAEESPTNYPFPQQRKCTSFSNTLNAVFDPLEGTQKNPVLK